MLSYVIRDDLVKSLSVKWQNNLLSVLNDREKFEVVSKVVLQHYRITITIQIRGEINSRERLGTIDKAAISVSFYNSRKLAVKPINTQLNQEKHPCPNSKNKF